MKRELVEGHKFNRQYSRRINCRNLKIVRAAIEVDGKRYAFVGWGDTYEEAQANMNTFLNPACVCIPHSDQQECPVHKNWVTEKLKWQTAK